ncbi:serine hydrolase [Chitinophagaceae bacterium 26-R-25]|nr:serine hydrolase [Chitinophagaceae bacterium 26-R-25]
MSQKSHNMRRYCSTALIFMLFFQFASAQTKPKKDVPLPSPYNFSALDEAIKSNQKVLGENSVVLIYKDSLIYRTVTGEMKEDAQEPIASCSKWLTAAVVMTFVDEGKISLDDEMSKYIASFSAYSKGNIRIKDCLSQTTGIESDKSMIARMAEKKKYTSLEDEVNAIASKKDIVDRPGKQFFYGNVGLDVAARVCEIVAKKPFERLVKERITGPLGMRKTTFQDDNGNATDPSGGAKSSAKDYLIFQEMLLNKGMYNGKRILSEESVALMCKAYTTPEMIKYAPKVAQGYNYALGAWVQEADESGKPTVLACPGLFGTWPFIDLKRHYACIIFTKSLLGEQKRDVYLQLKEVIDQAFDSK